MTKQYWVYVSKTTTSYEGGRVVYLRPHWKLFTSYIGMMLYKKIYGYSLVATGKSR